MFNWKVYISKYPDLHFMKTRQQAIRHFIHFGKKENRTDKIQVKNEVKNVVKIEVKNKNILKYITLFIQL